MTQKRLESAAVPNVSDRQFFQGLATTTPQIISTTEALDAVRTGTIPAPLQTIIDGIADSGERFAAEMLISGATIFERNHPLTAVVGAAIGWSSTRIDEFFIFAAGL